MIPGSLNTAGMIAVENDPDFASVSLLMHFDGADGSTTFTEETGKTVTPVGDAQIDTAFSVFGGASGLFDGSGDNLSLADSADWQFGSGEFSLEIWVRLQSNAATQAIMYYGQPAAANNSGVGWIIYHAVSNGIVFNFTHSGGTQVNVISSKVLTVGQWQFVQIVREGGNIKIRVDGVEEVSQAQAQTINAPSGSSLLIGRRFSSVISYLDGSLDDARITKGVARDNVVPVAAFPDF